MTTGIAHLHLHFLRFHLHVQHTTQTTTDWGDVFFAMSSVCRMQYYEAS